MTLSIITINYNNRDGLQRTLDSVVSQTFTDYEWIVIDGGSTDGSRELIEQYADHFAYWCSEPDKGIYNAMNKGIAHAKGEWLQFLNSGDWLYEDTTLEKVFSKEYKADILYCDVILHWPNLQSKFETKPDKIDIHFFLNENTLSHQSTFYNNTVFKNHLYNESFRIVSDWELYLILLSENYKFLHLPLYVSNIMMDGISCRNGHITVNERHKILENYIPNCFKEDFKRIKETKNIDNIVLKHKSLRYLFNIQEKIFHWASLIINRIENLKNKN